MMSIYCLDRREPLLMLCFSQQDVEKNGGKKTSDVMSDGRKAFFQYFDDTEGNNFAIYSYAK